MIGHDQLAKDLLEIFFSDLLRLVVPRFASRLDLGAISFLDGEHFTDLPQGKARRLDIVAKVQCLDDQQPPEIVLVNVEAEGQARKKTRWRLFYYSMQLRLRYGLPVISIVIYRTGGPSGIRWQTVRDRLWGRDLATFSYVAFSLSRSEAQTYLARPEPLAWALAALMQRGRWTPGRHKLECLRKVAAASELQSAHRFLLANFVHTYLKLKGQAEADYRTLLAEDVNQEVTTMELTWADMMEAKGHEKGLVEGERKGMQELLLRMIELRFGAVPDRVQRRIRGLASTDELGRLADRVLTASGWKDLGLG